jgi:CDP-diglyceride synthetase
MKRVIDAGSYKIAVAVYLGCAALLLVLLARWWAFRGGSLRVFVWCLLAALALTPTPVEQGSLAPAVIVGGFAVLTEGWESAAESMASLTIALLIALVASILIMVVRGRRRRGGPQGSHGPQARGPQGETNAL